jgi:hypothetical protein
MRPRISRAPAAVAALPLAALSLAALALSACSDDGGGTDGPGAGGTGASMPPGGMTGEAGGPAGPVGGAGMAGSSTGGSGTGGSGTGGSGAPGGSGGALSGGGTSGAGGGSAFTDSGVCGARGESPVNADSFEGYEEFYLIGDDGFGQDICVVRFDVARVGEAPAGCEDCVWTHRVEYRNPQILTDVDGVCASSELGMDDARIEEIDGSQTAYGFVNEYSGHVSVLMKYDEMTSTWGPNGNANWSEETGELRFDRRDGICGY